MRFLVLLLFSGTSTFAAAGQPAPDKVSVKMSVIRNICRHREVILTVAEATSISPRHMIGCLISEHTYLKNTTDTFVDVAAALGVYDDPSLGFAQIKLSTARPISRQLYGRELSSQEIIADLLNPQVAVLYMAQLIENIIIDYAEFGFDLSQSTGLICSSYLVGQNRRKALEHKKNKTRPQMNYYGRFAHRTQNISRRIESGEICE